MEPTTDEAAARLERSTKQTADEVAAERRERAVKRMLNSICRGC